MEEAELSPSSYIEAMCPPSKDRKPYLYLPPGYHAQLDPDVLDLRRADGSQVALFSSRGFVAEAVEQAAWTDYGDEPQGTFSNRTSSKCRPTSHPRVLPWPPRPPE